MAKKPNILCAGTCGRLLWSGSTSRRAGEAMCLLCRADLVAQDPRRRSAFCTNGCGKLLPGGLRAAPADERTCRECRGISAPGTHSKICIEARCERPSRVRGLCKNHYRKYSPSPSDLRHQRVRKQLKNHVRRGRTRAPDAERIDPVVVGDRDGWRCGICRRKVDRSKVYPHPRSPSVDHVIPQSQHGPHTYANVRIAHWDCNVARGNGGGNEQLALIG